MAYTRSTVQALYTPAGYVQAVMGARPLPTATNADRLGLPPPQAAAP